MTTQPQIEATPEQLQLARKYAAEAHSDQQTPFILDGSYDRTPSVQSALLAIRATEARLQAAVEAERSFQRRVQPWMLECFNEKIAADLVERCDRFLEEDLELVQAVGYSADRAHALVDYTFNRPKGDPSQEVGGVMVTLAALCLAAGLDMHEAGEVELTRISQPEIIAKIRTKQAAKPTGSALPVAQAIRNPS